MLNTTQRQNYKFILFVTFGWWLFCLLFSGGRICDISYTDCNTQTCNLTQKSWFGFGSVKNYVTFARTATSKLNLRETSGRLPAYRFSLDADEITERSDNTPTNFVSLPIDFYWQKSAAEYRNQLLSEQDFRSVKFNLTFLYFLNVWILALLAAGIIIWRKI